MESPSNVLSPEHFTIIPLQGPLWNATRATPRSLGKTVWNTNASRTVPNLIKADPWRFAPRQRTRNAWITARKQFNLGKVALFLVLSQTATPRLPRIRPRQGSGVRSSAVKSLFVTRVPRRRSVKLSTGSSVALFWYCAFWVSFLLSTSAELGKQIDFLAGHFLWGSKQKRQTLLW